eukprot:GHVP01021700.1.p1 GENE.GHVP01021700.1~~GHVP01021700.1.p1  ORF type:complete len:592 (+),score=99.88 GHVP01021700.1:100-1875(+)
MMLKIPKASKLKTKLKHTEHVEHPILDFETTSIRNAPTQIGTFVGANEIEKVCSSLLENYIILLYGFEHHKSKAIFDTLLSPHKALAVLSSENSSPLISLHQKLSNNELKHPINKIRIVRICSFNNGFQTALADWASWVDARKAYEQPAVCSRLKASEEFLDVPNDENSTPRQGISSIQKVMYESQSCPEDAPILTLLWLWASITDKKLYPSNHHPFFLASSRNYLEKTKFPFSLVYIYRPTSPSNNNKTRCCRDAQLIGLFLKQAFGISSLVYPLSKKKTTLQSRAALLICSRQESEEQSRTLQEAYDRGLNFYLNLNDLIREYKMGSLVTVSQLPINTIAEKPILTKSPSPRSNKIFVSVGFAAAVGKDLNRFETHFEKMYIVRLDFEVFTDFDKEHKEAYQIEFLEWQMPDFKNLVVHKVVESVVPNGHWILSTSQEINDIQNIQRNLSQEDLKHLHFKSFRRIRLVNVNYVFDSLKISNVQLSDFSTEYCPIIFDPSKTVMPSTPPDTKRDRKRLLLSLSQNHPNDDDEDDDEFYRKKRRSVFGHGMGDFVGYACEALDELEFMAQKTESTAKREKIKLLMEGRIDH